MNKKLVLILGGSTFMGKELLFRLSQDEDYEVHFINRGKKYWNNEVDQIKNVHFTYGNRDESDDFTLLLRYLSKKLHIGTNSRVWHTVVDFSCYKAKHLRQVYNALQGLVNLYVLISTDSIYDVCNSLKNPITEDQDIRPADKELYQRYKRSEDYGHNKLKCEEFLEHYIIKPSFPYFILRLPDVIGPYDDSHRMFAMIKWLQSPIPIEVDDQVEHQKLSMVYSIDVARFTQKIIKEDIYKTDHINQAYNLSFDETPTGKEFTLMMAQYIKEPIFKYVDHAASFYPSVNCGIISNQKIKALGVHITPLSEALKTTMEFFLNEAPKYRHENEEAILKLKKKLS